MRRRRALPALLALAFAVLGLTVASPAIPAADAVTGSPPVTTSDAVTVYPSNVAVVHPLSNDHDPDNDLLAVCRLGTEHYKHLPVEFSGDELDVFVTPSAKPGTYTFTYYACDYSYLVPGTVTITVQAPPKIPVKKVAGRPGVLRVTNPTDLTMRFLYGSFKEGKPDGSVVIAKGETVVIHVHRTRIDWVATNRRGDLFLAQGHVTGIELARAEAGPTPQVTLSGRLEDAWRTA